MTDTIHDIEPDSTSTSTRPAWFAPASSVLVATSLWLVAVPLAGAELFVHQGETTTEISPASVVIGSAIGGLGALGVGWATRRWSSRPRHHFVQATGLMLALSLITPLTEATSVAAALWLSSMHFAVGAVAIPLVAARLPRNADSGQEQE